MSWDIAKLKVVIINSPKETRQKSGVLNKQSSLSAVPFFADVHVYDTHTVCAAGGSLQVMSLTFTP